MRLRYVNKDHNHRLYGQVGTLITRSGHHRRSTYWLKIIYRPTTGPRNELVLLDSGEMVVAPWGNWRKAEG
jgi:hypothetical protein